MVTHVEYTVAAAAVVVVSLSATHVLLCFILHATQRFVVFIHLLFSLDFLILFLVAIVYFSSSPVVVVSFCFLIVRFVLFNYKVEAQVLQPVRQRNSDFSSIFFCFSFASAKHRLLAVLSVQALDSVHTENNNIDNEVRIRYRVVARLISQESTRWLDRRMLVRSLCYVMNTRPLILIVSISRNPLRSLVLVWLLRIVQRCSATSHCTFADWLAARRCQCIVVWVRVWQCFCSFSSFLKLKLHATQRHGTLSTHTTPERKMKMEMMAMVMMMMENGTRWTRDGRRRWRMNEHVARMWIFRLICHISILLHFYFLLILHFAGSIRTLACISPGAIDHFETNAQRTKQKKKQKQQFRFGFGI